MTQNFNDVVITGNADTRQLTVKDNATQTTPLQSWQTSGGVDMAHVTGDGRVEVGNNLYPGGPADAMVQINQDITLPTSGPTSGWHTLGRLTGALSSAVNWIVHELQLLGTGGVSGLQTAFRAYLTHSNSGTSTSAELRAIDAKTTNTTGSGGSAVGQATGIRATVSNAASAYLNKAVAVEAALSNDTGGNITEATALSVVPPSNAGTITTLYGVKIPDLTQGGTNYALYSGQGPVHIGDNQELKVFASPPTGNPPSNFIKVYPKLVTGVPHWFAKDSAGVEYDLSGSGGGGTVLPNTFNARLTLTSGTPVTTADVTGATQVYLTPFQANQVALYDGSNWNLRTLSEISIKLTNTQNGNTTNGSAVVTNLTDTSQFIVGMYVTGSGIPASATIASVDSATQVTLSANASATATGVAVTFKVRPNTTVDIFVFDNSGTPKLEMLAWNEPAKGTVTGATNATPIVITSNGHGLSNDQIVTIQDVGGNTAANGTFRVASAAANTFALATLAGVSVAGNGVYTSGGIWRRADQNVARATALTTQNGVYAKTGAVTRRYVGTLQVGIAAGQTEDSEKRRLVWNLLNRVDRKLKIVETGTTWTYSSSTVRPMNNNMATRLEVVVGISESLYALIAHLYGTGGNGTPPNNACGVGVDTGASNNADLVTMCVNGNTGYTSTCETIPSAGYHFFQAVENATGSGLTSSFWGTTNGQISGLTGRTLL